jgi:hypothetical protein
MSDFEYIKHSIKLKISLIKPKQKILYQWSNIISMMPNH